MTTTTIPAVHGLPQPPVLVAYQLEPAPRRRSVNATTTVAAVTIGIAAGFGAGFVLGWRAL
ncbi:hypothetical protein [Nocardia niwae]|uniref:hypothetical protein n=1 Tax=Nocardia niwae TaxID=626084 RepID=UPI0034018AA0